jgi:hypothetical protein
MDKVNQIYSPKKKQTPSEILVHRGVCILNGMAQGSPFVKKNLNP